MTKSKASTLSIVVPSTFVMHLMNGTKTLKCYFSRKIPSHNSDTTPS